MVETRFQVRKVLLITLVLNLAVAAGKIVLGLLSGVLAIVADGFHSLTDSAGNIAGLIANHYAAQPPDDDHPYGHRRFETLAALLIGALLLLTAWEIGRGAIERLQNPQTPDVTPESLLMLIVTLIINIFVSRYQIREGNRLRSEVLLADAKNTSADVIVTTSVIISTAIVAVSGWVWLDAVTALVVMGVIGYAALQILSQTGSVLVDAAPYTPEQLIALLHDVPDVRQIVRARSRGTTDAAHIDIDVEVAPEMTAEHTEGIAAAIRDRLEKLPGGHTEIEVHFAPCQSGIASPVLAARAAGDKLGLSTHEVQVSGDVLEMHVEVAPGQTLAEAHEQVSQLESDLKDRLPEIEKIVTHIEPAAIETDVPESSGILQQSEILQAQAEKLLEEHFPQIDWHDYHVRAIPAGFTLSVHAALAPQMSIEAAHDIAESAETLLKSHISILSRVTIHTEPFEH